MFSELDWKEERPLQKITCTSSDCSRDLHSFLRIRPGNDSYRNGTCRVCNADLIDWARLDRRDLSDIEHTFESLKNELIRHKYWHENIDPIAMNHAKRKGLDGLRKATERRLRKYVGPPQEELFRDGSQTPLSGNVIYYAQHATATCCRKCIEAWHGIDRDRTLTDLEVGYMSELVMTYVEQRLPSLNTYGIYVPRKRPRIRWR